MLDALPSPCPIPVGYLGAPRGSSCARVLSADPSPEHATQFLRSTRSLGGSGGEGGEECKRECCVTAGKFWPRAILDYYLASTTWQRNRFSDRSSAVWLQLGVYSCTVTYQSIPGSFAKYPTEVFGKVRHGLNSLLHTPARFSADSILVPDNLVSSVRPPKNSPGTEFTLPNAPLVSITSPYIPGRPQNL